MAKKTGARRLSINYSISSWQFEFQIEKYCRMMTFRFWFVLLGHCSKKSDRTRIIIRTPINQGDPETMPDGPQDGF
jgi:hypothetical protein